MKLFNAAIFTFSAAIALASIAPSFSLDETEEAVSSLRGMKLMAYNNMTCDKFPRVCRLKNGTDCCNKKCVHVKSDHLNCGRCGYKCKYTEICCKGKCVSASFDKTNCGGCNKKCKKGEYCVYGMCNYA